MCASSMNSNIQPPKNGTQAHGCLPTMGQLQTTKKNVSEQHDAKNFAHKMYWLLLDRVHVIRQETEDPRKWIGPALYWSSWNRRNNAV